MPTLKDLIRKKTAKFVRKELTGDVDEDTPLFKINKLCEQNRTNGFKFINKRLDDSNDDVTNILKQTFAKESGTKAVTYREINPKINVHEVYTTERYVEERKRVEFTKFRLSSHHLKIETGRWTRIQKEDR